MSGIALIWAANVKGLKPAAKVVLIQLADFHNKETGQCNPSAQRLADECEMGRSTLFRHMETLEEKGLLKRQSRGDGMGGRGSNQYRLNLDIVLGSSANHKEKSQIGTGGKSPKNTEEKSQIGTTLVPNRDSNLTNEPDLEPILKTKAKKSAQFPDDWMPNQKTIQTILSKDYHDWQIGPMVEDCINHHKSKGTTFKNFESALITWASNQIKFHGTPDIQRRKANGQSNNTRTNTSMGSDPTLDAIANAATAF